MRILTKSIIPELDGWEERLAEVLQNVDQNRTIGRLRVNDGKVARLALSVRSQSQIEADFWFRVNIRGKDECWEWSRGRDNRGGYGYLYVYCHRKILAHRVAANFRYGEIPSNLLACHHCDNPPCCNPSHLFVGTDLINARDRGEKGRDKPAIGSRCWNSKLTEEQVLEIRQRMAPRTRGLSQSLAEEFGVSVGVIQGIAAGRSWKHVTPPHLNEPS